MNNSDLNDKNRLLSIVFSLYIKNEWNKLLSKKQRNNKVLKQQQKNYQERMQKINIEIYQMKKNIQRENMEEIDIIICLRKRNKN